jgi:hypothetical protein
LIFLTVISTLLAGSVGELDFCNLSRPLASFNAAQPALQIDREDIAATMRRRAEAGCARSAQHFFLLYFASRGFEKGVVLCVMVLSSID